MMSTITELIGLPGTGKSHWVHTVSKHNNIPGSSHIVDLGVNKNKLYNTLCGFRDSPMIFGLLAILFILNLNRCFSLTEVRPYFVVLERLGRNCRIKRTASEPTVLDEGAFQFVWRIFCNLELNNINLFIGKLILKRLSEKIDHAEYFMVGKTSHLERVTARKKAQKFDVALIAEDQSYIKSCRASMYCLVVFLRNSSTCLTARRV